MNLKKLTLILLMGLLLPSCFDEKVVEDLKEVLDADNTNTEAEKKMETNKFTGEKKDYYPDGNLRTIIRYENGKREGISARYYNSGDLCFEQTYKDGKRNGPYRWFHKSGKLHLYKEYKDDKLDGTFKEYNYSTSSVKYEGVYRDGVPCAPVKEYNKDGSVTIAELVVKDLGYNKNTQIHTLKVTLTEDLKDAIIYYADESKMKDCFTMEAVKNELTMAGLDGYLEIPVKKGGRYEGELMFVGKGTMSNGMETIATKKYKITLVGK